MSELRRRIECAIADNCAIVPNGAGESIFEQIENASRGVLEAMRSARCPEGQHVIGHKGAYLACKICDSEFAVE